jgi:hypothetical protein
MMELPIDKEYLRTQIRAMLSSDMPEPHKTGLHSLLAELQDILEDLNDDEGIPVKIVSRKDDASLMF